LSTEICNKNTGKTSRETGSGDVTSVLSEEHAFWPWVAVCYIFVVVDGFAHEGVWVISSILKEFPCNILPVLPDGWKICFPMELSVSDEPEKKFSFREASASFQAEGFFFIRVELSVCQ
jgi:hypothetical protein